MRDEARANARRETFNVLMPNAQCSMISPICRIRPNEMHQHPPSHESHEMHMEMRSTIDLADPMSREASAQVGCRIRRRCTVKCSCSVRTC